MRDFLVMIPLHYFTKWRWQNYGSLEAIVLLADIGVLSCLVSGIVESMYRYVGVAQGDEKRKLISNCLRHLSGVYFGGVPLRLSMPCCCWRRLLNLKPNRSFFYSFLRCSMGQYPSLLLWCAWTQWQKASANSTWYWKPQCSGDYDAFVLVWSGLWHWWRVDFAAASSVLLMLCLVSYQWQQMAFRLFSLFSKDLEIGLPTLLWRRSIKIYRARSLRWQVLLGLRS